MSCLVLKLMELTLLGSDGGIDRRFVGHKTAHRMPSGTATAGGGRAVDDRPGLY